MSLLTSQAGLNSEKKTAATSSLLLIPLSVYLFLFVSIELVKLSFARI